MMGTTRATPTTSELYKRVVARANSIFKSNRGIYRSAWIVKEYRRLGGEYSGTQPSTKDPGLRRWFKEKWIDLNRPIYSKASKGKSAEIIGYEPCGRSDATKGEYPLCRPMYRITKQTPKTVSELSASSITKAKADKKKVKANGNIKFKTK